MTIHTHPSVIVSSKLVMDFSLLALTFIVGSLGVALRLLLKWLVVWDDSPTCLVGKTAIITGANTGIGFYTALNFAQRGARVILACRDRIKAQEAKAKITAETDNANVIVKVIDFASLASVRQFAKEINSTEKRIDILVNNAGVSGLPDITTSDGFNLQMQINYFGQVLLTFLLLDLLKKSTPSRIVNLTSYLADFAELDPNNLNAAPKKHPQLTGYANSKLCTFFLTKELAKSLKGSGVTVNCLHPGSVNTGILRNVPNGTRQILEFLTTLFYRTPEEGAQTVVYVSVSKDIENVSGKYFYNCKELPMIKSAENEDLGKKVWKRSLELLGLAEK